MSDGLRRLSTGVHHGNHSGVFMLDLQGVSQGALVGVGVAKAATARHTCRLEMTI
jgi:hypothetical protein